MILKLDYFENIWSDVHSKLCLQVRIVILQRIMQKIPWKLHVFTIFYVKINFCLYFTHKMTISHFADRVHVRLWPLSTGSHFLCCEPLIEMITVQSLWHIIIRNNFWAKAWTSIQWLLVTSQHSVREFSRVCSHYDVIVRSYLNGWHLF